MEIVSNAVTSAASGIHRQGARAKQRNGRRFIPDFIGCCFGQSSGRAAKLGDYLVANNTYWDVEPVRDLSHLIQRLHLRSEDVGGGCGVCAVGSLLYLFDKFRPLFDVACVELRW